MCNMCVIYKEDFTCFPERKSISCPEMAGKMLCRRRNCTKRTAGVLIAFLLCLGLFLTCADPDPVYAPPFKWQWLIENGYSATNLNQPVTSPLGAHYRNDKYFRPTESSQMRSDDTQFGPVNTYHMQASFLTRMGDVGALDHDGFVWHNYPLAVFLTNWPPGDF